MRIHLAVAMLAAFWTSAAPAQTWPSRTIELIVPYPAGGQTDLTARALAEILRGALGGTVIVVNRGGAGGVTGMTSVASAPADGHTLAFTPMGTITAQPHRAKTPPYTAASFDYLCRVTESALALAVKADNPAKSLDDFVAATRRDPGKLAIGNVGQGSIPHLYMEHFARSRGINALMVAYRGAPQVVPAILGGEIAAGVVTDTDLAAQPQLRPLALMASQRLAAWPDVPTFAQAGIAGLDAVPVALVAPKGLPAPVRARLEAACRDAVASPAFKDMAEKSKQPIVYGDAATLAKVVERDSAMFKDLIDRLGLKNE